VISLDPASLNPTRSYLLQIACIQPRPIALVATCSAAGVVNLAPFSYFTGVASTPPTLCLSISRRQPEKDTYANLLATRELVVHMVDRPMAERMVACSADYPPEVNELATCGFTAVASEVVKPPRVAEAPIAMECRLRQVVEVVEGDHGAHLVLATILRYHVSEAVWNGGRIDSTPLDPIGRLGGQSYCTCRTRFDLPRPPKP